MLGAFKSIIQSSPRVLPFTSRPLLKTDSVLSTNLPSLFHTCMVLERARKGTRERKRKVVLANIKKKAERLRKNPKPIPYKIELMLRSKGLWGPPKPIREVDKHLSFPTDNVFFLKDHAIRRWYFEDAIQNLREHYHPTMLDRSDELVFVKIELDMRWNRKDKYLDEFSKMVPILHAYDRKVPDRAVMAFVPNEEMRKLALEAGALFAGGEELITDIVKGRVDLADVDYFLCHEDLSANMKPLVGLLREKLPKLSDGTIGADMEKMVKTFGKGMFVDVHKMKPMLGIADEPDYGYCEASIGRLDMEISQLKDNLDALMETLNENKPKRKDGSEEFLTRCIVKVLPLEGEEAKSNLNFSVIHPLIIDNRLDEQAKVLKEGREEVLRRVQILKGQN